MPATALLQQLLAAGLAEDFAAVAALPGAGNHALVLRFSSSLRAEGRTAIDQLAAGERAAFIKALAVYENTVSGLGSVTALRALLPLMPGPDAALVDWVLSNTRSYDHYAHGARSLDQFIAIEKAHVARRAEREQTENDRAREAQSRRAERATVNLRNAVRRGDLGAVRALLGQGAACDGGSGDRDSLERYADDLGHTEIAEVLRLARQVG